MKAYSAIRHDFEFSGGFSLATYWHRIKTWSGAYRSARSQRKTEKILENLDRKTLEDIGIPHDDTSPMAGVLNRYPRVITVKSRGI